MNGIPGMPTTASELPPREQGMPAPEQPGTSGVSAMPDREPILPRPDSELQPPSSKRLKESISPSVLIGMEPGEEKQKTSSAPVRKMSNKERRSYLENLMKIHNPGWEPEMLKIDTPICNPIEDNDYVKKWVTDYLSKKPNLQTYLDKKPELNGYADDVSELSAILQSGRKLKGELSECKDRLRKTCWEKFKQDKDKAYMKALEQATKAYQIEEGIQSQKTPAELRKIKIKRKQAIARSVLANQKRKADRRSYLEKLMKKYNPGWEPEMLDIDTPINDPTEDYHYVRQWITGYLNRTQELRTYLDENPELQERTDDFSGLFAILQSKGKLPKVLQHFRNRFKVACSSNINYQRNKAYLEALEKKTEAYQKEGTPSSGIQSLTTPETSSTVVLPEEESTKKETKRMQLEVEAHIQPESDQSPESGATPMDTSPVMGTDEKKARIMAEDRNIKQWIVNGEGYYINTSLPNATYMVDPHFRRELLSDSLRQNLSLKKQWVIGYFNFNQEVSNPQAFARAMLNATETNALDSSESFGAYWLSETHQPVTDLLDTQLESQDSKSPKLSLVPRGMMVSDGTLVIFNASDYKTLTVKCGKGKNAKLGPKEGVFLQADPLAQTWNVIGNYRVRKKSLDTNPLLRDNSPLVIKESYGEIDDSDTQGEYFLTPRMLKDLAAEQSKKAGRPAPALCMTDKALEKELRNFRKSSETFRSLITGYDCENHFVAVRLIKSKGRILVYIHETLGQANSISCQIQQILLKAVHSQFAGNDIYFLTSESVTQKDFSSCGVTVLKTLRAFDKRPHLDQWLLDEISKRPRSKNIKPPPRADYQISPQSGISLQKMRPELLKTYQGDLALLTEEQRQTLVSHKPEKMTLEEYISSYQREIPSLTEKGATSTPNFAGYCKRYKYLLKWEKIHELEMATRAAPTIQVPGASQNDIHAALAPLKEAGDLAVVNKYLLEHFANAKPVSEKEWEAMLDFEALVLAKDESATEGQSAEQIQSMYSWVEQANDSGADADPVHSELTKLWLKCILEDPRANPQWHGKSPAQIAAMLLQRLENTTLDTPVRAGTKRRRVN